MQMDNKRKKCSSLTIKKINFAYQIGASVGKPTGTLTIEGVVNCCKLVIFWVASLKMLNVHIL